MAYASLQDTRGGLPDPQTLDLWDFVIPGIPNASSSDGRDMAVICQSCEYPGRGNEITNVQLHGVELNFSGRATMPRTLSVTYVERSDMLVTNTFQGWFEYQRGTASGLAQNYKVKYALDGAVLLKYDITGVMQSMVSWYGLQPEDMPNTSLDGTSSGLWTISMSFRYDFYRLNRVPAT